MDVQAFYKALARVISERTETEIKVKEIQENVRKYDGFTEQGIRRACN
jgi:hypothetical protein